MFELVFDNNITLLELVVEPDSNFELLVETQDPIILEIDLVTDGLAINGIPPRWNNRTNFS